MTHDDLVLDLFTRGDPMAEPARTTSDVSASDYLRHLERRSGTMTLNTLDTPDAATEPPKRKWSMVAASVATVALVGGLLVVAADGNDEVDPLDEPDPTVPDTDPLPETTEPRTPDVAAGVEPLPVAGTETVLASGRYSTDLLGVDLEFEISDDIGVLTSARAGMLQFAGGYPEQLTTSSDYTLDQAVTISFQRLAGWSTPEEATLSQPDAASIDPSDVDTWIERNDVTVVADRDITVDGRSVRVLDVAVDEPAAIAPLGCVDVEWQCTYYGATAEPAVTARSRQDALTVSPFRETRFWIIPISPASVESDGGSVPLLVTVTVPEGAGDYLDTFEDGVIRSMTFDGDDAPIGWTAPSPSDAEESEPAETDEAVETSDPQLEDATALLDG